MTREHDLKTKISVQKYLIKIQEWYLLQVIVINNVPVYHSLYNYYLIITIVVTPT